MSCVPFASGRVLSIQHELGVGSCVKHRLSNDSDELFCSHTVDSNFYGMTSNADLSRSLQVEHGH